MAGLCHTRIYKKTTQKGEVKYLFITGHNADRFKLRSLEKGASIESIDKCKVFEIIQSHEGLSLADSLYELKENVRKYEDEMNELKEGKESVEKIIEIIEKKSQG